MNVNTSSGFNEEINEKDGIANCIACRPDLGVGVAHRVERRQRHDRKQVVETEDGHHSHPQVVGRAVSVDAHLDHTTKTRISLLWPTCHALTMHRQLLKDRSTVSCIFA